MCVFGVNTESAREMRNGYACADYVLQYNKGNNNTAAGTTYTHVHAKDVEKQKKRRRRDRRGKRKKNS